MNATLLPIYVAMDDTSGLLEEVMDLPAREQTSLRALSMLDDPFVSLTDVGSVLELEPSLATRLVFLANSPYYGIRERVATPDRAIMVIGLDTTRALVASVALGLIDRGPDQLPDWFWRHGTATAVAASVVADRVDLDRRLAFSIGLLHDVGAALLHRRCTDPSPAPAHDGHERLGAEALAMMRFPASVVDAVASHHDSASSDRYALVLRAADAIATAVGAGFPGEPAMNLDRVLGDVGVSPALEDAICHATEREIEKIQALLGP